VMKFDVGKLESWG